MKPGCLPSEPLHGQSCGHSLIADILLARSEQFQLLKQVSLKPYLPCVPTRTTEISSWHFNGQRPKYQNTSKDYCIESLSQTPQISSFISLTWCISSLNRKPMGQLSMERIGHDFIAHVWKMSQNLCEWEKNWGRTIHQFCGVIFLHVICCFVWNLAHVYCIIPQFIKGRSQSFHFKTSGLTTLIYNIECCYVGPAVDQSLTLVLFFPIRDWCSTLPPETRSSTSTIF